MEENIGEKEKKQGWKDIVRFAKDAAEFNEDTQNIIKAIKRRLDQDDATDILKEKNTIENVIPEIIELCKKETLPMQTDTSNEIKVQY